MWTFLQSKLTLGAHGLSLEWKSHSHLHFNVQLVSDCVCFGLKMDVSQMHMFRGRFVASKIFTIIIFCLSTGGLRITNDGIDKPLKKKVRRCCVFQSCASQKHVTFFLCSFIVFWSFFFLMLFFNKCTFLKQLVYFTHVCWLSEHCDMTTRGQPLIEGRSDHGQQHFLLWPTASHKCSQAH